MMKISLALQRPLASIGENCTHCDGCHPVVFLFMMMDFTDRLMSMLTDGVLVAGIVAVVMLNRKE